MWVDFLAKARSVILPGEQRPAYWALSDNATCRRLGRRRVGDLRQQQNVNYTAAEMSIFFIVGGPPCRRRSGAIAQRDYWAALASVAPYASGSGLPLFYEAKPRPDSY